jgi:hypothetical protein
VPFTLYAFAFTVILFMTMLGCLEVGRRIGARRLAEDADAARAGIGVVEGSVFGLLGLLLAFTVSGAAERFDTRRHLIADGVNAIGTAWKRIDVAPLNSQSCIPPHCTKVQFHSPDADL